MLDLIVIGGGPAGYTAAIRAAQLNMSAAIVEKKALGGTCLNRGCIPTKALLHAAGKFAELKGAAEYGITMDNAAFDLNKAYAHKDEIVAKLVNGIKSLIKSNKIEYYEAEASFIDAHTVQAGGITLEAKNILIAVGSAPASIPVPGIEYAIDSDAVLAAPVNSDSVIIIGGGVIGAELANIFADAGKSVMILEALDRLLPMMDVDLGNAAAMGLKKKKVKISTASKVTGIFKEEGYKVTYEDRTGLKESFAGCVIICTGRKPVTAPLKLENAGIKTVRGYIPVDGNMCTGVPGIYAAGDVTGSTQLAHFASAQGITAVESMLNLSHSIDLKTVPSCVYVNPELASVGLSEAECQGREIEVGKFPMGASGKAAVMGASSGFVKTIIDKASGKIIGASIAAAGATDLISELALAVSLGLTRKEFLSVIHPHPTLSEALRESAEDSEGLAINFFRMK